MCGIAGVAGASDTNEDVIGRMLSVIAHRGPDDTGIWRDEKADLVLGHRRLSIIDTSPAGHQPMLSPSGRYAIVFNGEIYNFEALRLDLEKLGEAPQWRGHSDTEVLLASIDAWGVQRTLERSEGMFAFALWDRRLRTLTLARDRMGEKPLYFGWVGGCFAFASELKALAAHPRWTPRVESDRIWEFLRLGYYGGGRSLVSNVFRLPPGSSLTLAEKELSVPKDWSQLSVALNRYWDLRQIAFEGQRRGWQGSVHAAANELEQILKDAVAAQMVADVPVGAFLSGGIDSSLVVALMRQIAGSPVKTFCIGFDDPAHDEAAHARRVAKHLGTDHHELYVDDRQALDIVPEMPALFDEPLADPSQLPTLLVARLARQHVTVALTGDGGDELFAGYARYPAILRYWKAAALLPPLARRTLFSTVRRIAASDALLSRLPRTVALRLSRLAARHEGEHLDALRRSFIGGIGRSILLAAASDAAESAGGCSQLSALRQLQLADQLDYLPDDILMKVDRAAMSTSLETRVPMLDARVVAFSWRMRDDDLLEGTRGKRVLRHIAYRYVPRSLLDRPKQGFAPPIGLWLRGALRPWAESLLRDADTQLEGVADCQKLRLLWQQHLSGRHDAGYALWRVLMYIAWAREHGVTG